jgi:hypothetical protein
MKQVLSVIAGCLITGASLVFLACDAAKSSRSWVENLVDDPVPLPAVSIVLACDHSLGSTCGQVEMAANVDAALPVAAARPGSTVALWSLGSDLASTRELVRVESPQASTRGDRARSAQQRLWLDASRTELLRASRSIFSTDPLRASPIAEGISAIALSHHGPDSVYVISTDELQVTRETFDFECKKLPERSKFLARLKTLALLAPGSLTGTRVIFANARITAVGENRCPMSMSRIATVRSLWSAAITNAGGTVRFTADSVTAAELGGMK